MNSLISLFVPFLSLTVINIIAPNIFILFGEISWSILIALVLMDIAVESKRMVPVIFSVLFILGGIVTQIICFMEIALNDPFIIPQNIRVYFLPALTILALITLRKYFIEYCPYYIKNPIKVAINLFCYCAFTYYLYALIDKTTSLTGPSTLLLAVGIVYKYIDSKEDHIIFTKYTSYLFILISSVSIIINLVN